MILTTVAVIILALAVLIMGISQWQQRKAMLNLLAALEILAAKVFSDHPEETP